jgi:twitching motility protein PilT
VALEHYLASMVRQKASDLHVVPRRPPLLRIHGELLELSPQILSPQTCEALLHAAMTPNQQADFRTALERDFVYESKDLGVRFRVNAFHEIHGFGAVFRRIASTLPSLEALGFPEIVDHIADLRTGLILITGPASAGKSTTLAAIVERINNARVARVISLETPVEYLHQSKRSIIAQREVGRDARSFADGLRLMALHDPDVVVIGEIADLETCRLMLAAAERGCLVLAALHARTTTKAVDRLIDAFPLDEQPQIRATLADALRAIVAQQLVPAADKQSRILACEVLLGSSAVTTLIREGRTAMLLSAIQSAAVMGMQTMDGSLLDLWKTGKIGLESARTLIRDKELFARSGLAPQGPARPNPPR